MDPDTQSPMMKYFTVVAPTLQNAKGIKKAIENGFEEHGLSEIMGSDGASVNSRKDLGLGKLFQDNFPHVSLVWCFSHRLEQSLHDALKTYMDPRHIFNASILFISKFFKESM